MEKVTLTANERKEITKSSRSTLRKNGRVPGIYYSKHSNPIAIDVLERSINPLVYTSKTNLISLKMDEHDELDCIIRDVQFDPVTDRVIHFDLLGLTKGEKLQLEIPVKLKGSAAGIKEGGVLQHFLHKLEIECLPVNIPEHIEVDVSGLQIGDSIHVKDISLPEIEILNPEESMIVMISHQKVQEEASVAEEGVEVATEPEVISKGKADSEEDKE
jgi:large subunit ribosomal protein L25